MGVAPAVEHLTFLKKLQLATIVDVGANRGQFSLVANELFPNAQIFSFEPIPEAVKKFKQLFASSNNVKLYELALGKIPKTQTIYISGREDSSSLLPITELQDKIFPGTKQASQISINVAKLKDILSEASINRPSLLKIDVQGYELEVLGGCEEMLMSFDYLYIECSFVELYEGQALAHQVIKTLSSYNFVLDKIYNLSYDKDGSSIQADFVFKQHS